MAGLFCRAHMARDMARLREEKAGGDEVVDDHCLLENKDPTSRRVGNNNPENN